MVPCTFYKVVVDSEFPSVVVHHSTVLLGDRSSEDAHSNRRKEDVARAFVEIVETDAEFVLEECGIETYIECLGLFPGKKFITHCEHKSRHGLSIETVCIEPCAVCSEEVIEADILLVTVKAVGSTEFKVPDLITVVLHEVFLRKAPADAHCRKETGVPYLQEL